MQLYYKPDWSRPAEWILHPLAALFMLPIMLAGYLLAGLAAWCWNVRYSSSLHGSWRPVGPLCLVPDRKSDANPEDAGSRRMFLNKSVLNYYHCPDDNARWADIWSCTCNGRCPICGKEVKPFESEDI